MLQIIKNLKTYWKSVIVIFVLLIIQAVCDLALPSYTSSLIDTGIQNYGVEHVSPYKINEKAYTVIDGFMNDEDADIWERYYEQGQDGCYYMTDEGKEHIDDIDEACQIPMMMYFYPYKMATATEDNQLKSMLQVTGIDLDDLTVEQWIALSQMDLSALGSQVPGDGQNTEEKQMPGLDQSIDGTRIPGSDQSIDGTQIPGTAQDTDGSGMTLKSLMESMKDKMGDENFQSSAKTCTVTCYEMSEYDYKHDQIAYLVKTGVKMLGMTLLMVASMVLVGLLASRVGAGVGCSLREQIFTKVISFSDNEINKFSTASLITRSTNDVQQIQMVTVMLLRMVLYAPILAVGGIIKVINTGAHMGWIIVIAVIAIIVLIGTLMVIAMPKFKSMQKLVDRVNLVSREILTGIPVIRAFGREKKEEERFDEANKDLTKTMLFVNRVMTFMMPLLMLLMFCVSILIEWVAAHRIDEGTLQVGAMTAFITYTMLIIMSFLMLSMMSIMLPRAGVAADRIKEVLDTEIIINDRKDPVELKDVKGIVRYDNVSFKYPDGEDYVLKDVNFIAKPGQTTAIIGSTGCGKSTLVNLIPRFYDVTEGSITIDGTDVRDASMDSVRRNIGYVPQKGALFSGTIESNIKFGAETAGEDDVKLAADIAQATDFINEKPESFKAPIAQGGTNVSGGQKQRLAIARAIARKPRILIFDDSFSALDFKTDVAVRKALSENVSDSTVFIVAQRVSTILHADQILVIDEGKIAGIGTHRELMRNCEEYRQIAQSQLSEAEIEASMKDDKEEV